MYLKPCRNCSKRTTCKIYRDILQSLRGTGLTSAKFVCDIFKKMFWPGVRVTALMFNRFENYDYESDIDGTVTNVTKEGKVTIMLDEEPFEDSVNRFIRLWPKHIKALDKPDVKVCRGCGIPEGEKNVKDWLCDYCVEPKGLVKDASDDIIPF